MGWLEVLGGESGDAVLSQKTRKIFNTKISFSGLSKYLIMPFIDHRFSLQFPTSDIEESPILTRRHLRGIGVEQMRTSVITKTLKRWQRKWKGSLWRCLRETILVQAAPIRTSRVTSPQRKRRWGYNSSPSTTAVVSDKSPNTRFSGLGSLPDHRGQGDYLIL